MGLFMALGDKATLAPLLVMKAQDGECVPRLEDQQDG